MDIYAPLAHRLGMGKVRGELEDLAFRYTDPVSYEQMSAAVEARRVEGEQFLRGVEDTLAEQLRENNIDARVEWRIKRLYSIFQKIQRANVTFDQVYDFLALRVITQDVSACYAVFGLIHALWRPVPGRIKDFIAIPRANRYQSLHTTVIGDGGHQFEVQIRTEEMHRIAEEGIAAHWKYKAGESIVTARDEERLNWIRQLVEWQKEMTDPNEFLSSLKMDLYPDEVYTFTPKGKVVVVPGRRHAGGFRLHHSHRSGPHLRGRQGERPHGAAAHQAAHRRHRRNRHQEGPQAQPRLAHLRQEPAGAQQDQALAQRGFAPARSRDRAQAAGAEKRAASKCP